MRNDKLNKKTTDFPAFSTNCRRKLGGKYIFLPADELKKPERPKSAPALRLKNSKRTSKCQVLSSTVPELEKNPKFFRNFFEVSGKSHSAKKCKRGAFGIFRTSILLQNRKKIEGGPFGDITKICKKVTKPK